MKYILSGILWMIGLVYFTFFLVFALIVSFVFPPRIFDPWIKIILRGLFKVLFCRVEAEGAENVDPEKTYIFMSNHVSIFDIPLLGGFIPGLVRGIESNRQHRWPLYGLVMGRLGNIPIERDNIHRSISSFKSAVSSLHDGVSLIILPEGFRTKDGNLLPFKKLPFHLAKQSEMGIIPIGISGLFHFNPRKSKIIQPTKLKISFGEEISAKTVEKMQTIELRDLVREKIQNLIEYP